MSEPTDTGRTPSQDPEFKALAKLLRPDQVLWERYRLIRRVGVGGFGVVWHGRDEALNMGVALKFLADSIVHSPDALEDLKRETRVSLRLTHPSIVRIYGFHSDEELAAISMEYVDGGTLSAIRRSKPNRVLEPSDLGSIVSELCQALDYAHTDVRIVHRDLKPGNLMLNQTSRLKVTDFGISSTISETQSRLSMRRSSAGTPAYMSPQQMLGQTPTVADDIYALGATLFELLTGKPPFYQGDIAEQVRTVAAPSVNERREAFGVPTSVPDGWEHAIAECLRKDPTQRPESALAVLNMLDLEDGDGGSAAQRTRLASPGLVTELGAPAVDEVAADEPSKETRPATHESEPREATRSTTDARESSGDPAPSPQSTPHAEPEPSVPEVERPAAEAPAEAPAPLVAERAAPSRRPADLAPSGAPEAGRGRGRRLGLAVVGVIAIIIVGGMLARPVFQRAIRDDPERGDEPTVRSVEPDPSPGVDAGALQADLDSAIERQDWAAAEEVIEAVIATGADAAPMGGQLDRARSADLDALSASCDRALGRGEIDAARRAVLGLEARHPERAETAERRERLDNLEAEHRNLSGDIDALIAAARTEEASQAIERFAERFPGDPSAQSWRESIASTQQTSDDAAYRERASAFETALASGDRGRAARLLEQLRAERPDDAAHGRRQRRLDDAATLGAALDAFSRALDARTLDLSAAERTLVTIESLRPGDGDNVRLRARLEGARAAQADALASSARAALDRDQPDRTEGLLTELEALDPNHAQLQPLRTRLGNVRAEQGIREVVRRYEAAKETRDADAYAALFVDGDRIRDRTRSAFADLESQRVEIEHVEIERNDEGATVTFHERVEYKATSGGAQSRERTFEWKLTRVDGRWLIASVSSRD